MESMHYKVGEIVMTETKYEGKESAWTGLGRGIIAPYSQIIGTMLFNFASTADNDGTFTAHAYLLIDGVIQGHCWRDDLPIESIIGNPPCHPQHIYQRLVSELITIYNA